MEAVIDHYSADSKLVIEPDRAGVVSRYVSDIDKVRKIVDYTPSYSFGDELSKTIQWYEANGHLFEEILEAQS